MSKYTTGEIAKLCGVSVRTVQYYDTRGILIPSELSEGGRRLYSEDDLAKMKTICFLREIGLPINSISKVFAEEKPQNIISILLEQQEKELREELSQKQTQLELVEELQHQLKSVPNFSVESIGDIARIMKSKNKLRRMRWAMVLIGIPVTILQWTSIIFWITHGLWWLFPIWLCLAIPYGICASTYYLRHTANICPECHEVFRTKFKNAFWAYHTPTMRRLTCPKCGHRGLCVEIYADKEIKK